MSKRVKLTRPAIKSREEMETLVCEIATLKLAEKMKKSLMDEEINAVREQYKAELSEIATKLDTKLTLAVAWAEDHPEEFGDRKSIDMVHGTVGWRKGMPQLRTMTRWTWKKVLEKLKTLPAMKDYIRTKEEVDKDKIIADRNVLDRNALAAIGVKIEQDDTFFVEPRLSNVENREARAAA